MTNINFEWAERRTSQFIDLLLSSKRRWDLDLRSQRGHGGDWAQIENDINQRLVTLHAIAEEVYPGCVDGLNTLDGGYTWRHATQLRSAQILLGALQDSEELARNIGPQGPNMAAQDFHPWVWDHAVKLWADGYPREAGSHRHVQ